MEVQLISKSKDGRKAEIVEKESGKTITRHLFRQPDGTYRGIVGYTVVFTGGKGKLVARHSLPPSPTLRDLSKMAQKGMAEKDRNLIREMVQKGVVQEDAAVVAGDAVQGIRIEPVYQTYEI